jgi:hydrogenase maturation protein HypF
MIDDGRRQVPAAAIAAGFHQAVARLIADVAERLASDTGIDRVALSGGVFQNALLLRLAKDALTDRNLRVLTHRAVPPNDGGLALGQAAVAGYPGADPLGA